MAVVNAPPTQATPAEKKSSNQHRDEIQGCTVETSGAYNPGWNPRTPSITQRCDPKQGIKYLWSIFASVNRTIGSK